MGFGGKCEIGMITLFTIKQKKSAREYDVKDLVTDVSWVTDLGFSAGTLNFSLFVGQHSELIPRNGDEIEFCWDNKKVFKGRIFKCTVDDKERYKILAYDNLRYLKNEDTIVFPVSTGTERFERIMNTLQLPYRSLNLMVANLEAKVCDGETYFSMLQDAVEQSNRITKDGEFFVRCNYDVVEIVQATDLRRTTLLLDEDTTLTGWNLEYSADDLYNVVKVTQESGEDKERKTFTVGQAEAQDSIAQYGQLTKVERADKDMNIAQMENKARQLLDELNREKTTLSFTSTGVLDVRAGQRFFIATKQGLLKERELIADKVTHNFGTTWSMDVQVRILGLGRTM